MKVPNFSVIIPSLANETTKPYLKLAVESLRNSGFDGSIIVVTNGSKVKPDLSDIRGMSIHLHTRDQGQCNAVNRGVEVVNPSTDYLLISNDDMYYAPGWNKNFRNHLNTLRSFEDLVFSPNLIEPTNNNGSAKPFLKLSGGYTIDEFNKHDVDAFVRGATEIKPHNEDGFNLPFFIRLDVWRAIGGYDQKYDPWGSNSDTDLQTKINLAGITPIRLRDVLVYHFSNKSGTFDGTHQEDWQRNFQYYREKWGFTRDDDPETDVWYNTNMIIPEKLIYHPAYEGKYAPTPPPEPEEDEELRIEYDL